MTITIGIDPHKASHTAVAIDSFEFVLDELRIRSCSTQVTKLRDWADGFRDDRTWTVESAQGLGYLLAQQLIAAGETVLVPAVRASRVRTLSSGRSQKNDPNDARSVAIDALRADDLVEVLPHDRRPIGPAPAAHRRNEQQLNSQHSTRRSLPQRSNVEHMSELHRDLAMPPNPRGPLGSTFWAAATDLVCRS
ncbi:MAG: transposase [Ilumatobacter sp.]|uniref:IS110 family transposase n=1 Tax=Ilumatobacter sp. TaxID=1967498 RepID=UPI003C787C33